MGLCEYERTIEVAFERHGEHLFRTPLGVPIGGVEDVDADLEADVDEARASPTFRGLRMQLNKKL